jgi:hypothetical protein
VNGILQALPSWSGATVSTGIAPAQGMSILRDAHNEPEVAALDAEVARWSKQVDHYTRGLAGTREDRRALEPQLYDECWGMKARGIASFMPIPFLAGMAGTVIGVSHLAAAVPGLAPFRGLLMIGALVASWKYVPRGIGWVVRKHVLPPMVDRAMVSTMERYKGSYENYLATAERNRDKALEKATERLWEKAQKKEAERQADRANGKVEVRREDEAVNLGGVRVGKKKGPGLEPGPRVTETQQP